MKIFLYCRLNGDEPVSTLTQDFHTRLDNLLRTLVHARPHFVRCLRSNSSETPGRFDRATVMRQIRSLQVLETVNLMAGGKFSFIQSLTINIKGKPGKVNDKKKGRVRHLTELLCRYRSSGDSLEKR